MNTRRPPGPPRHIMALAAMAFVAACGEMPTDVSKAEVVPISATANAALVFESGSHVKTWDAIHAPSEISTWPSTVCGQPPVFGLNANWQNPHNAFVLGSHPWAYDVFFAPWINAYNSLTSVGPGGHNWTRYQTTVQGNGAFVIKLMADNCSWVYLDGILVGVQTTDRSASKVQYGLTLNGTHTLDFVIFDGGGANGGKYVLETTTNPPPPLNPDLDADGHPNVSDAYPLDPTRWEPDPATITLTGLVRDFQRAHADFESYVGDDRGIVQATLGADSKPVYAGLTGNPSTHGQAAFDQWYRNVSGVNMARELDLVLTRQADGTYRYSNSEFFPIDNELFGNEGFGHNYHFTTEIHTNFTYRGGETFSFTGDDDVFVFINGKLAIDLGGVHGPESGSVALNDLGLTAGNSYSLDIFQAERKCCGSSFSITTSLQLVAEPPAPVDNTPPAVAPVVSGTLGANGWYTSNIAISWSVTDPESDVTSTTGCGATSVTADTDGATFTCTATSVGGTAGASVTVKRDASAPSVTPTISGTAGANGWYTSNVIVSWATADAMSGASACASTTTTTDNTGTTYSCTSTNGAGLATTLSVSAKRDASAPSVVGTVSGTIGNGGWYTSDVNVSWATTDATSGIVTSCAPVATTTDNAGTTYSCTATNGAGLSASASVAAKRDATQPTIGYTGNAGSYTIDQSVAIACAANDAMSGLASNTCAAINGAAYTFAIGANSYAASATDNAGNANSATANFTVVVTGTGLCALVERFVSQHGVANSLCVKIRQQSWGAFRNEVNAQSGKKWLSTAHAAILLRMVDELD
jgi:fibro-slime domain-containing protein